MGFADTSKEIAACLNACIEAVHAQLQAQNKHSTVPIENVGIPDSAWHFRVVYTAFRLRKKQFTFKKVSREKWAEVLLDPRSTKCYLVDGILNISFRGRKGTKQKEETISQLFDPEISIDGNWRHSTAVMHGFVVDDTWVWEEHGIMSAKYLWLGPSTNKPDPAKGFYKDIYNVFEVDCGQATAENMFMFTTEGKLMKVLLKQLKTTPIISHEL
jgi:hypothetical protein